MGVYSVATRTVNVNSASAALEIIANAVVSPRLIELCITSQLNSTNALGLGRPAAIGLNPVNLVTVQPENLNDPAGQTQLAVQWGTPPTVPAAFVRRATTVASVGAGIIWSFPRGMIITVSKTLVLWLITGGSIVSVCVTVVE